MTNIIKVNYTNTGINNAFEKPKSINLKVSTSKDMYIIHRAIVQQLHKRRQGNANSKTRSEVEGSGKKPWKQKGTGRARVGSIRSPLWRGGGVIFGPKPKNYRKKINKKEHQLALRNLLYNRRQHTLIVDNTYFRCLEPNTKFILSQLKNLHVPITDNILIIVNRKMPFTYLSIRNLNNIQLITADQINTCAIMKAKFLVIDNKSLDIIQTIYHE